MPTTWSFDTIKRFSTLDTLEEEGSFKNGPTDGKGLYKSTEDKNDKIIAAAKSDVEKYEDKLKRDLREKERQLARNERVRLDDLPARPRIRSAEKLPEDLSPYITFLHPWMHEVLNVFVLWVMFVFLFVITMVVLKIQDTI